MPAPAENALEILPTALDEARQILINQEINSTCAFTRACGSRCILSQTNSSAGKPLDELSVVETAIELAAGDSSHLIRHYCMAGKEPFESSDRILRISRAWHSKPSRQRAGTIGAISSSASGIRDMSPRLAGSAPLSWVLASMDAASTGMRTFANNRTLLDALEEAHRVGAIGDFGINTLLTEGNHDEVIEIGRIVSKSAAAQWSVGTLMAPRDGVMSSAVDLSTMFRMIERLSKDAQFSAGPTHITMDLDYESYCAIAGTPSVNDRGRNRWRFEHQISKYLTIIALNHTPGRFLRVRWDGELLSMSDFMTIGQRHGRYGNCKTHRLSSLLRDLDGVESHRLKASLPALTR